MKFNFKDYELYSQLLDKKKSLLSDQITRKGGLGWVNWLLQVKRLIQAKAPTKSDVRIIKHFSLQCYMIHKKSGLNFLVNYLKTNYILLQQYVARNTTQYSSWDIGKVGVKTNRKGLPTRLIPRLQRRLIRKGDVNTIKFYLSLFGLYRYLICSYKRVKFDSITSPGSWVPDDEFKRYAKIFASHIKSRFMKGNLELAKPFSIEKVTTSVRAVSNLKGSSITGLMLSIWNWRQLFVRYLLHRTTRRENGLISAFYFMIKRFYPGLMNIFLGFDKVLDKFLGDPSFSNEEIDFALKYRVSMKKRVPSVIPNTIHIPKEPFNGITLGRISLLKEAAGKVRKIAIFDPYTQWLLKPIHDLLFGILGNIPQDGTFEQFKPIEKLIIKVRSSLDKYLASCDLSDATDRLSAVLQRELLVHLIGYREAYAWHSMLCNRSYRISILENLNYSVGQPMGALSSFAGLSLAHHFLWQWAAWESGYLPTWKWFTEYGVLGDDSVSRIKIVIEKYIEIIKRIGAILNLSKSLLSPSGCLEFAKRFITPRGDCSPISIGEIVVSSVNFSVMTNWPRKHSIRIFDLLSMKGYKHVTLSKVYMPYKKLPRRLRNFLIVIRSPWGAIPFGGFIEWLGMDSYIHSNSSTINLLSVVKQIVLDLERLSKKLEKLEFLNSLLVYGDQLRLFRGDMIAKKMGINLSKISIGDVRAIKHFHKEDPLTMGAIQSEVLVPLTQQNNTVIEDAQASVDKLTKKISSLIYIAETFEMLHSTGMYVNIVAQDPVMGFRMEGTVVGYGGSLNSAVVNKLFEEFLLVEDKVNSINPDIIGNNVRANKVIPSPISVVRLWNRYRKIAK